MFIQEFGASLEEISLVSSEDTHYSVNKAANLLQLDNIRAPVDEETREVISTQLDSLVKMLNVKVKDTL